MMLHRIVSYSLSILILVISGFACVWVVTLSAAQQPIMLVKEPMPVLPLVVQAGEALELMLDYEKQENLPGSVGLSLVAKGTAVPLSTFIMAIPAGKHRIAVYVQIPPYAPAGNYRLYLTKQYRPSIFRDDTITWESVPFDVVKDHPLPLAFAKPGASP